MQGLQGADREAVVAADHTVKLHAALDRFGDREHSGFGGEFRSGEHQRRVQRYPGLEQRLLVAEQALAGGAGNVGGDDSEKSDAAASARQEVARGIEGGRNVVDHHVVGHDGHRRLAEQDQRGAGVELGNVEGLHAHGVEDDAVDQARLPVAEHGQLGDGVTQGLLDDHPVAAAGRFLGDVPGQFREVRVVDLGNGQGDHPCSPRRQAAGREIRAVAELVDGRLHLGAQGRRDVGVIVHDVGDGLH